MSRYRCMQIKQVLKKKGGLDKHASEEGNTYNTDQTGACRVWFWLSDRYTLFMPRGTGSLMCGMWSKQKLPHDGQQHGKQQESGKHISFTWLHTNGIAIVLSVPAPASCADKNANLALTMFSWTLNTPKRQQCNMCIKMDLWVFFFLSTASSSLRGIVTFSPTQPAAGWFCWRVTYVGLWLKYRCLTLKVERWWHRRWLVWNVLSSHTDKKISCTVRMMQYSWVYDGWQNGVQSWEEL